MATGCCLRPSRRPRCLGFGVTRSMPAGVLCRPCGPSPGQAQVCAFSLVDDSVRIRDTKNVLVNKEKIEIGCTLHVMVFLANPIGTSCLCNTLRSHRCYRA